MNTSSLTVQGPMSRLYQRILSSSNSPQAFWWLGIISFCESSFFPLPPDLLLIPMLLADRSKAWKLALWCTFTSVIGGMLGYAIGYFLFESLGEWIVSTYSLEGAFSRFQIEFQNWGFWIIALKGLTPIPFKVVTIASGVAKLPLSTFFIASIIARAFRFSLLASTLYYLGPQAKELIEKRMGWVFALTLFGIVLGFIILKWIS